MTADSVKKTIKERFGTMSNFARQAEIDRYELQKLFARKEIDFKDLKRLQRLATGMRVRVGEGDIDPRKLERLKRAVMKAGGVYAFCKENKQFSRFSVYQVLQGKYKRMSPGVSKLFAHFQIE